MPITTRGGKKFDVRAEHYGAYAHANSTLPGQRKKKSSKGNVETRQQKASQPPIPTFQIPTTPPDDEADVRRLRQSYLGITPYCSIYGRCREALYPSFYFCSGCHQFDQDKFCSSIRNKIRRSAPRYKCRAKHESFACPTETKAHFFNRRGRKRYVSGDVVNNPGRKKRRVSQNDEYSEKQSVTIGDYLSYVEKMEQLETTVKQLKVCNENFAEEVERMKDVALVYEQDNEILITENKKLSDEGMKTENENALLRTENRTLTDKMIDSQQSYDMVMDKNRKLSNDTIMNDQLMQWNDRLRSTIEHLKHQNQLKVNRIEELEKQLELNNRKLKYHVLTKESLLAKFNETTMSNRTSAKDVIDNFIVNLRKISNEKNRNLSKLAKTVVHEIWNDNLLNGFLVEQMVQRCKGYFRATIFSPQNLLRTMDMYGGQLSMNSIEIMRTLETKGDKRKYSMLPSSGAIKNVCKVVDAYSQSIVPFTEGTTQTGAEFAEFAPADVVGLIMKAYNLKDVAKERCVVINQAIDGAQLSSRTHHCTYGLKVGDKAAVDPITKNFLFGSTDKTTLQSKNQCFPLKIVFERETKEIIKEFRPVMEKVRELTKADVAKSVLDSYPIKSAMDSDLSATWKLCARGGAAKRKKYPCTMCAVCDESLEKANAVPCERWCLQLHRDKANFKCYHHEFLDPSTIEDLQVKLNRYREEIKYLIPELNIISTKSKINTKEDPRGITSNAQFKDHLSIHYDYAAEDVDDAEREEYGKCVRHDLRLRKISGAVPLPESVARLKHRLVQEYLYKKIHDNLLHAETGKTEAILLMHECVPCILHLENRTGLKIISLILHAGLTSVLANDLYGNIKGIEESLRTFVKDVEAVFNEKIFGSSRRKGSYRINFNFKDKKFEDVTMDNNRSRLVMLNCTPLIRLCIVEEEKQNKWISIIGNYNKMMKLLRYKEEFSDELIFKFQLYADEFFQEYMSLNGRPGITNYFHMIGSGHIGEFLLQYRNLYMHSQQGWEAFNSYMKVFFFRRTTRGGGRGDNNRVRQIARWLSRRLIWMAGASYDDMCNSPDDQETDLICNIFESDSGGNWDEKSVDSILDDD